MNNINQPSLSYQNQPVPMQSMPYPNNQVANMNRNFTNQSINPGAVPNAMNPGFNQSVHRSIYNIPVNQGLNPGLATNTLQIGQNFNTGYANPGAGYNQNNPNLFQSPNLMTNNPQALNGVPEYGNPNIGQPNNLVGFPQQNNSLFIQNNQGFNQFTSAQIPAIAGGTGRMGYPGSFILPVSIVKNAQQPIPENNPEEKSSKKEKPGFFSSVLSIFTSNKEKKVVWEWQDESGKYQPYNPQISSHIEECFKGKKDCEFPVQTSSGNKYYSIDFGKMTQMNRHTRFEKPVKRKES